MKSKAPKPPSLFGAAYERESRQLPVIGEQKDIRYYSSPAKSILNGPETTGMGFWSINPYIGCAFGCAYCYARYTHRYVMERAATDERMTDELGVAYNKLPPWLAFERNIFVKKNAGEVLSRTLRFGSDRHLKTLPLQDLRQSGDQGLARDFVPVDHQDPAAPTLFEQPPVQAVWAGRRNRYADQSVDDLMR